MSAVADLLGGRLTGGQCPGAGVRYNECPIYSWRNYELGDPCTN